MFLASCEFCYLLMLTSKCKRASGTFVLGLIPFSFFFQSTNDIEAMTLSIAIGYYGSTIHKPKTVFSFEHLCRNRDFVTPLFRVDKLNTTRADENKSFYQVHEYQTNSSGRSGHQLFLYTGSSKSTVQTPQLEKNFFSQKMHTTKHLGIIKFWLKFIIDIYEKFF